MKSRRPGGTASEARRQRVRQQAARAALVSCGLLLVVGLGGGCGSEAAPAAGQSGGAAESVAVERLTIAVRQELAHDPASFTQGLVIAGGELYESRGQYGESSLRRLDRRTGELLVERPLAEELFGEGLAAVGERLIQLTWRAGVAIVWDRAALAETGRFAYRGEGWGLCWDGRRLFHSDGSSRLTVRDPESFAPLARLEVTLDDRPLAALNELECAEGWIWANLLGSDEIARIDPRSGRVTAVVDASGLLSADERAAADVLNGIAYDPATGTFLLTGKLWPKMFEVTFVGKGSAPGL